MRQLAMLREIATVVVGLALVLVAIGVVFFVGMRTGSPLVRNVVRRFNPAFGNPHQMKTAGTPAHMSPSSDTSAGRRADPTKRRWFPSRPKMGS